MASQLLADIVNVNQKQQADINALWGQFGAALMGGTSVKTTA